MADLPMWWPDFLAAVRRYFTADSDESDVRRAFAEMTAAAEVAVADHHRLLKTLGMRQPGEQAPFEAWAKTNGYDTRCIGPRYTSQRTKDAERGWMARSHTMLGVAPELKP